MCSIMGYCAVGADFDVFKAGLIKTTSRGPDDMRIVDTGAGLLGFLRLSIMLQLVCTGCYCELFNH